MTDRARLVQTLSRLTERLRRQVYDEMPNRGFADLRPAHSAVLRHLPPGGARMVALAEAAGVTKQSMAYLVSSLVEQDLVRVDPDPTDGRARLVTLTPRGRLAVEALVDLSMEAERRLADGMGADRVKVLNHLAAQALSLLEEDEEHG